jgi:O-methyltransferase
MSGPTFLGIFLYNLHSVGARMISPLWSNKYLSLVEDVVTGSVYPHMGSCDWGDNCASTVKYDRASRFGGNDWPVHGYTMIGHLRLRNIRHAIETCVSEDVPGDFVELGVWRGGAILYAKAVLDVLGVRDRRVVGVDAFEDIGGYGRNTEYLSVDLRFVVDLFERFGLHDDSVVLVKGFFSEALPQLRVQYQAEGRQISVLRMDSNYYDSHMEVLFNLYEFVPVGGYVIFDDWSFPAVQKAWADFAAFFGCPEIPMWVQQPEDGFGAFFRKVLSVSVEQGKLPSPTGK